MQFLWCGRGLVREAIGTPTGTTSKDLDVAGGEDYIS
jgi:hypothetical protein